MALRSDHLTPGWLLGGDGALLGTYAVGPGPTGIAFDETNVWVANYAGNSVSKLRVSDGSQAGTYGVSVNPYGIAFDGTNIWAANAGSGTVTKM